MTKREPRRKVLVRARMRLGNDWSDVTIRNMSSRGLMAQAVDAPVTGSYVEIRRGRQIVIGRTVWCNGQNFGVRTQDRIDVEAIVTEVPQRPQGDHAERRDAATRHAPSAAQRLERSRRISSAAQFLAIGAIGVAAAFYVAQSVFNLLSAPLTAVRAALGGG